jgi:hypothetical protein
MLDVSVGRLLSLRVRRHERPFAGGLLDLLPKRRATGSARPHPAP